MADHHFKKGQSGNPSGKPSVKTERNRAIKKVVWKNLGETLDKDGCEKFWRELQKLKGEKYVKHYLAAMEFFKPKYPRLTIKDEKKQVTHLIIERNLFEGKNKELNSGTTIEIKS
jgi:hypothetical protein